MTTSSLLVILFSLAAPLFAWPIELFIPYASLVEEPIKAGIIYLGLEDHRHPRKRLEIAAAVGLLFGISESVLYLFSYLQHGTLYLLPLRLLLAVPMHILTSLVIALPATSWRKMVILGLPVAMLMHFFYNFYLV